MKRRLAALFIIGLLIHAGNGQAHAQTNGLLGKVAIDGSSTARAKSFGPIRHEFSVSESDPSPGKNVAKKIWQNSFAG